MQFFYVLTSFLEKWLLIPRDFILALQQCSPVCFILRYSTQQTDSCWKCTTETLGKGMNKVNSKDTKTMLLTCEPWWTCFTPFSTVSIDDFEQVNIIAYRDQHAKRCETFVWNWWLKVAFIILAYKSPTKVRTCLIRKSNISTYILTNSYTPKNENIKQLKQSWSPKSGKLRDENAPAFGGIPSFPPIFYLFQSSNYISGVNCFCKKLFTLWGNIFLYDYMMKFLSTKPYNTPESPCFLH